MTIKAYVKDGIYIPIRHVKDEHQDQLVGRFERQVFLKEATCEKCDYFSERVCDVCESCANYGGTLKLHRTVLKGDKEYLRLPFGDRVGVTKIFGDDVEFIDRLPSIPMKKKIKFTATLKDYQKPAVKAMQEVFGGVLKSAPRTGKTVMSAYAICKIGEKTLIMGAQKDWLDNFYETFVGSETQEAMTTASKKRIGFPKKLADFEKLDICLCTYQMFLRDRGKKLLKKIRKMFSVLVVDEVQTVPAAEFSKIVSQLECRVKHGLSGTPERKDGKEWTAYKLMGPVYCETKVERLRPEVHITETGFGGNMPKTWVHMVSKLEKDPNRLKVIIKTALKDVKAGHLVLIPMTRVVVIKALAEAINREAGKKIAAPFYGGIKKELRKETIERARNYKVKILVGNSRLLSTGINIPRASMLYEVTPSSNQPKADQRFSRVLTPMDGKPQPGIRYFLDDFQLRKSCISSEFWQTLWPKFRPRIRGDVREKLFAYMSKRSNKTVSSRPVTGYL